MTTKNHDINGWEHYNSENEKKEMYALADKYLSFLTEAKTEKEVVTYIEKALKESGFSDNTAEGTLIRKLKGKTLLAARRGKRPLSEGFRMVGAHGDSPRIDFKQHPLYESCDLALAKTHYYGGIRKYQWLARPLAIHGTVVKMDGTEINIVIGEKDTDPVFTITDLLPHLAQKEIEKKVKDAFDAEKLNLVLGSIPDKSEKKSPLKNTILNILKQKYAMEEEDFYSAEIQIVPADKPRYVGLDSSLIGSYGHDDRVCVFAALEAFLNSPQPEYTQIFIVWDKEEIGSEGSTGAQSHFFDYCIEDMKEAWDKDAKLSQIYLQGKMISADVNAGLDPDYQDAFEKMNSAKVGYGPCFNKFTGSRGKVGANDAHPEYIAFLRNILKKANIPWQMAELGKVDLGGGGTVAKFLASYGIDVIDMGPAVLSMHSPFEIVSVVDLYATAKALSTFYKS